MMESVTNVEAVISAFVKTMLPDLIDDQIASLEDDKEYYQEQIDNGWDYNGYYQDRIDELDDQIQVMEDLKDQIAASSEDVSKPFCCYGNIMSIEEMVTAEFNQQYRRSI
jgi:chromosome segregation ATPase